jgi:3-phenylpropionate/trans-cinnamate dioxygenase ferredoxin component
MGGSSTNDGATRPRRLISVSELGESGVAVVEDPELGSLAVGLSDRRPFATSNRCRHLYASLGNGHVTEDGSLQCPWHGARYDVRTGRMIRGPQGAFRPLSGLVQQTAGRVPLATHEVVLRDGAIWLA